MPWVQSTWPSTQASPKPLANEQLKAYGPAVKGVSEPVHKAEMHPVLAQLPVRPLAATVVTGAPAITVLPQVSSCTPPACADASAAASAKRANIIICTHRAAAEMERSWSLVG